MFPLDKFYTKIVNNNVTYKLVSYIIVIYETQILKTAFPDNAPIPNTSMKRPWKLVYVEEIIDKRTALIREKALKRCNTEYLRWLISSEKNIFSDKKILKHIVQTQNLYRIRLLICHLY